MPQKQHVSHSLAYCRSKAKNAQEAHEAIRPTKAGRLPNQAQLPKGSQLARLYSLIWARALASQMSAAQLLQVTAHLLTHCLHWLEQAFASALSDNGAVCRQRITHLDRQTRMQGCGACHDLLRQREMHA